MCLTNRCAYFISITVASFSENKKNYTISGEDKTQDANLFTLLILFHEESIKKFGNALLDFDSIDKDIFCC